MGTRTRGTITLGIILFVAVVFCGLIPFVVMPANGIGVALPVISVPGEVVQADFLPGWDLTNSFIGTVVTGLLMLLITAILWRMTKGWKREVPSRLQSMFEIFIGGFRNFLAGIAGDKLRTTPLLWPLVATIFFFLLTANYMKLMPGVETVGKMHCSYTGFKGYPMIKVNANGYQLWVDSPLDAGATQTAEMEELCNYYFKKGEWSRYDFQDADTIRASLADAQLKEAEYLATYNATVAELDSFRAGLPDGSLSDANADRLEALEAEVQKATDNLHKAEREVQRQEIRLTASEQIFAIDTQLTSLRTITVNPDSESGRVHQAQMDELIQQRNFHLTQMHYPTATLTFTQEQLDHPAKPAPFLFHITPFVRGPATDLSLAFMLAILSIVMVQVYGVWALGPAYFEKFINITALGNLGKRPMGAIDFVVGLIEIISEIGKIVSLAFRLFGNLFAGGVALMAVTFLVAVFVPGIIYGLELIIGGVQALVFAVLTVVFSVQAQESHHHDDDHDHAEEHA